MEKLVTSDLRFGIIAGGQFGKMLIQDANWNIQPHMLDRYPACPAGIPVATVALDGVRNAGILAAQILSLADMRARDAILRLEVNLRDGALEKSSKVACRPERNENDA